MQEGDGPPGRAGSVALEPVATPPAIGAAAVIGRVSLYTTSFRLLCLTSFLGFSGQNLLQPVLPLLVIALGGDATLGGAVIAVFSLPSVVLRPWIGRLADAWSQRGVLLAGIAGIAASGLLYLVPSLPVVFATRLAHGAAWASFNTGAAAMLAVIVPPSRRGEAAGIWSLLPGIAGAAMPAVGLALLAGFGFGAPFVVATMLAVAALGVGLGVRPAPRGSIERRQAAAGPLIDRVVLLPTAIELAWALTQSLFLAFPPIVARERGIPLDLLPAYYIALGAVMITGRFAASRVLDRFSRPASMFAGVALGAAALIVGAGADDIVALSVAGCLYAAGGAAMLPASLAVVLDVTASGRAGAAMATYSLGHQLGLGAGALLTGALLDRAGADAAYLSGLVAVAATGVLVLRVPRRRAAAAR